MAAARKKIIDVTPPPVTEFATHDLYMAAYFQARDVRYRRAVREGNRITFVYDASEAAALRDAWFDMSGQVSALGYANAIRNLKNLVANVG